MIPILEPSRINRSQASGPVDDPLDSSLQRAMPDLGDLHEEVVRGPYVLFDLLVLNEGAVLQQPAALKEQLAFIDRVPIYLQSFTYLLRKLGHSTFLRDISIEWFLVVKGFK